MIAIFLLIVFLCMNKRESFDISRNILINPSLTNVDGKTLIESENDALLTGTKKYANQMYTSFSNYAIYETELEKANINYANLQTEYDKKIYDASNVILTLSDISSNIGKCIQKYYTNGSGTPQADPKDLSMFQTSRYLKNNNERLPVTELMAILKRLRQSFARTMNAINIYNYNLEKAYGNKNLSNFRADWLNGLTGNVFLNTLNVNEKKYIKQRISRFKMLDVYPVMNKYGDPGYPIYMNTQDPITDYECNCDWDCQENEKLGTGGELGCPIWASKNRKVNCKRCNNPVTYSMKDTQDNSFYNTNGYYNTDSVTNNKYLSLYKDYRSNNALLSEIPQLTKDFISYIEKFINLSNWNENPLSNDFLNAIDTQICGKNTPLNAIDITTSNCTTASYYNKITISRKVFDDLILKYSTAIHDDFISLNPTATAMTHTNWLTNHSKNTLYTEQANVDYNGNDIGNGTGTLETVKALCDGDPNCKGFNWNPTTKAYWYKHKLETSSTLTGYNFYTKGNWSTLYTTL